MIRGFLSVLATLTLLGGPTWAIEPEQREVIVTHNRVWDGYRYHENFVPSDAEEILLMEGGDNAVAFVRTQEYYWPLARQKYVAFETQRDEVAGTLRVFDGRQVVAEVSSAPYVIHYPKGAVNGDAELLWSDAAIQAFAAHKRAERAFARDFSKARQAQSRYEQALKNAAAARLRGVGVQEVAAPPPPPEPSLRLVTQPRIAYRINLPVGRYEVAIFLNDAEVAGTRKQLRVIEDQTGDLDLVIDVVPEERWTRPIAVNASDSKIYVGPGAVFFATLHEAQSYDEAEFVQLTRPQAQGVTGKPIWVRRRDATQQSLQVAWADKAVVALPLTAYKVDQTRGAQFGYVVRVAQDGETPDLQGFAVQAPREGAVRGYLTSDAGATGLTREIVVVHKHAGFGVWGIALLPLVAGAALLFRPRRRGTLQI